MEAWGKVTRDAIVSAPSSRRLDTKRRSPEPRAHVRHGRSRVATDMDTSETDTLLCDWIMPPKQLAGVGGSQAE